MAPGRLQVQQKLSEWCPWPLEAADLDIEESLCSHWPRVSSIPNIPTTECQGQIGRRHRGLEEELGLLLTSSCILYL